jgi:hypothetical protein
MTARKFAINDIRNVVKSVINEGFYDSNWISALQKEFNANVKVDLEKSIKPLYGGGSYTMIGYEVILKNPSTSITGFILEGLQINGIFVNPAIIVLKNNIAELHGSLKNDIIYGETQETNIKKILSLIKNKLSSISKYNT